METKTKHGYTLYKANEYHKFDYLFCRDDSGALEDIRELLASGKTIEVVNDYDTFYGCSWGNWLMKNTSDIANAQVKQTWTAFGYCAPFPSIIILTPKSK